MKRIRMSFLAVLFGLSVVQGAYASGYFEFLESSVVGACAKAYREKQGVKAGTTCRFDVHFYRSEIPTGGYMPDVTYWFERRDILERGGWRRFTGKKSFSINDASVSRHLQVDKSFQYRVAVDFVGQTAFADIFSEPVKIYVRK